MAVEHVERLLRNVTTALEKAGIPYAVIGGNAVAAWVATVDDGAVRATKDVDILLRRDDLHRTAVVLREVGLEPCEVHGVHMFLERSKPNPKTGVHVVVAGEHVRAGYAYPAPDVTDSVSNPLGYQVIGLLQLVVMKLQANRFIDRAHLVDMKSIGLVDKTLVGLVPEDLRDRLLEILMEE